MQSGGQRFKQMGEDLTVIGGVVKNDRLLAQLLSGDARSVAVRAELIILMEHHAPRLRIGLGNGIAPVILLRDNDQIRRRVRGIIGDGAAAVKAA